ncbi:hypothetical protein [Streptomyces sp. NPDC127084]|uniref:hypothetical protein n=1 Tax=Streptomyces sp. NPDC127084 TaxID=3347133 RepID=UPI0036683D4D
MHDEIADRIWQAVTHWVNDRQDRSVAILATLATTQTPSMMFGVACGIATVAKAAVLKMQGPRPHPRFWGIATTDGSRPEDVIPAHHLFTARFIAAHLNNDTETALALYQAAYMRDDPDLWAACLRTLLAAAGEAVRAAVAEPHR